MKRKLQKNIEYIMDQFYPIGAVDGGGVTRLGYTEGEDLMHQKFLQMAKDFGLKTEIDQVGNSYAFIDGFESYHLIGSHLDSIIDGGRYDGIVGVAVGLAILKACKEEGLNLPIKTVAFRCEESANFMNALMGSGLITGQSVFSDLKDLKGQDGRTLEEVFEERGYSKNPKIIDGIKDYSEVHIEQGRILEENSQNLGLVHVISGGIKILVEVEGQAEHSGATPMNLRLDSLCGVGEMILAIEDLAKKESKSSVATVGFIENYPNAVNVVPGYTKFSIDIRDINNTTMESLADKIVKEVVQISNRRDLSSSIKITGKTHATSLSPRMVKAYEEIAKKEKLNYRIMGSGATHDCLNMSKIVDSMLVFIPCRGGVSHNPLEYASTEDMALGADLVLKYIIKENGLDL